MTPQTIKAARAGLEWSQNRLAKEAGVHPKTVARWENQATRDDAPTPQAIGKMQAAFERHGVSLTSDSVIFSPSQ